MRDILQKYVSCHGNRRAYEGLGAQLQSRYLHLWCHQKPPSPSIKMQSTPSASLLSGVSVWELEGSLRVRVQSLRHSASQKRTDFNADALEHVCGSDAARLVVVLTLLGGRRGAERAAGSASACWKGVTGRGVPDASGIFSAPHTSVLLHISDEADEKQ